MDNSTEVSAKILERIRALLAMGSDTSSEHEAAIALKRARKLMDDHQVTFGDIKESEKNKLGVQEYALGSNKQSVWISALALNVARLNDCVVGFTQPQNSSQFIVYDFKGFDEDVKLCEFMTSYLVDTCNHLYLKNKARLSLAGETDKEDYLLGMSDKIVVRIKTIIAERDASEQQLSDGRGLIVSKATIVKKAHGTQKTRKTKNTRTLNYKAYRGGRIASNEIFLGSFLKNDVSAKHGNEAELVLE